MYVTYNGVDLQIEHITQWSDRNIYTEDGTERLYRHVVLGVQFVIHPETIAGLGLVAMTAPQIVVALKRRLLTPRRRLAVVIGTTLVLGGPPNLGKAGMPSQVDADPRIGASTLAQVDARTGPNPLHCDVIAVHGTGTFIGTFAIETWQVETQSDGEASRQSALISNRWQMQSTLDQNYLCTRVIQGKAIFRGDFLYELTQSGDYRQVTRRVSDYIAAIDHPLPRGYQRLGVDAQVSSNGLACTYSIVDQEQPTLLAADHPIAKVEAMWKSGHAMPEYEPTSFVNYVALAVRVWGRRDSGISSSGMATRQQLINFAVKVAQAFGYQHPLNAGMYYAADMSVDLVNKFVALDVTYRLAGIIGQGFGVTVPSVRFLQNPSAAILGIVPGANTVAGWINRLLGGPGTGIAERFPEDTVLEGKDLLVASKFIKQIKPVLGTVGAGQPILKTQSLRDGSTVPSPAPTASFQSDRQRLNLEDATPARAAGLDDTARP